MSDKTMELIRTRLSALNPVGIELIDDSAAHVGHAGAASGGGHYQLRLISARFTGQSKIARHRLVYDALRRLMPQGIHALAIQAHAPDEPGAS